MWTIDEMCTLGHPVDAWTGSPLAVLVVEMEQQSYHERLFDSCTRMDLWWRSFLPSCWLDCLVGVWFDRRLVSVGLVLSCFFFVWLGPMSSDMENWFECKGVGVAPRGWIGGRRAVNHGARGEARRSVPSASATREGEDEDVVGIVA